jgi:enterochelin esterase-like enzyme
MAANFRFSIVRYARRFHAGLGFLLLLASCAPHARAALPKPDPSVAVTPSVCRERAGQIRSTAVRSTIYGTSVATSIYLPPCYAAATERLPVIYLLHGGNADETQWPDLRVQPAADELIAHGAAPFAVVMPGGDYRANLDYATFVLNDLLPAIEQQFHVSTDRAERAIGGISLGGYWALKMAFRHPELFAAAGGHSPVVDRGQADDPLALARTADGLSELAVTLDVGDADALRANTEQLARVLQARRIRVAFTAPAGKHDRVYWRAHSAEYLRFYRDALALGPSLIKATNMRSLR